jgi:hypothetical protein
MKRPDPGCAFHQYNVNGDQEKQRNGGWINHGPAYPISKTNSFFYYSKE